MNLNELTTNESLNKKFEIINLNYKFNIKSDIEKEKFNEVKKVIFVKYKDKKYIKINNKIFNAILNENLGTVEIGGYFDNKIPDGCDEFYWTSELIELSYIDMKLDKMPFIDKKRIKVETLRKGIYLNVSIIKEEEKYLVYYKDEIIGKVNNTRHKNTIESINVNKDFLVMKEGYVYIYSINKIDKLDNAFNISVNAKDKNIFKRIRRKIIDGSCINGEIWMFISKNDGNNETKDNFILHLLDEKYFCSFSNGSLIVKNYCKKNSKNKIYAIVRSKKDINVIQNIDIDDLNNMDISNSEFFSNILNGSEEENEDFFVLMNKYRAIEEEALEEMKKIVHELRYKDIVDGNTFRVSDDYIEDLSTWQNKVGAFVQTKASNRERFSLGSIESISEKSVTINIQDDLVKSVIPKKGILNIDTLPSEVMQKRRDFAFKKLSSGATMLPDLNKILVGKYHFDELIYRKKLSNFDMRNMNEKQIKAVEGALNTDNIFIIQGPPGTGKTTVIRKIVKSAIENNEEVLISSFQNLAVDNVLDGFLNEHIIPYRYGSTEYSYAMKNICNEIVNDISKNIENNISNNTENKLKEYKNKLKTFKSCILFSVNFEERINLINETIQAMKEFNGSTANYNYIKNVLSEVSVSKLEVLDTEKVNDEFCKNTFINMLPESFENPIEDLYTPLNKCVRYVKKQNRKLKSSTLDNIITRLNQISAIDIIEEITENEYKKHRDYIIGELKLIKSSEEKVESIDNTEIIDEILKVIDKEIDSIPEYLEDSKYNVVANFNDKIKKSPILIEEILRKYADVKGTTCQKVGSKGFSENSGTTNYFYSIIDEAGRANPLDLLIPMINGRKVILVGDHKQLPHMLESYVENKFKDDEAFNENLFNEYIKDSLFGRLYSILPDSRKIMLDTQYRMNKEIGDLISELFYNGNLKTGTKIINDTPIYTGKSLIARDIVGKEKKTSSGSFINEMECEKIIDKLKELNEKNNNESPISVGIISFYKSQVDYIRKQASKLKLESLELSIGTVDSYQGLEKDIIFLSTVRSNGVGFTANPNRLNVALSRAKKLIVIFSNMKNTNKNSLFKKIFEKCNTEER
ncbi:AAA domain-containing protein [Clostridium tarantellae]|uniref:AAA family ATPase n=1 Tax=Clostridium tarantellae TaxID=39493 RepID=A0A6I1MJV3_9CLOT|nr:AAA domain-containing protein [Clostridium tarantellae]MPQ43665.1 AAA family ATPase [Clostridium tarantellae]